MQQEQNKDYVDEKKIERKKSKITSDRVDIQEAAIEEAYHYQRPFYDKFKANYSKA